jgi:predicted RNase H-like HicB family nuclease
MSLERVDGTGAMLKIEIEREDDGRWLGVIDSLPGVMAYGATEAEARKNTAALAFHVIAERLENNEPVPDEAHEFFARV